ncbi:Ger(x)C family spore germination protein [Clostridium bowmanii]|uniref:Ger(x)C family spore germination protein n=1 Tax=Clostridium bowmanii TaxID=132925 RepID=UPI001C0B2FC8|nr:Ger(x)C family spore germination protein [Clostridium bowmanii]MBU3191486.1 Ger(x)C family spore germination protein [Clostridium bowmanii]MCA1075814.1 Ger(x)C family spore germination protein [Clostridium bowmanii]
MKRYSILIISISCIVIYLIFNSSKGNLAIEKIDICSGLSFDLITSSPINEYNVGASTYAFPQKDKVSSVILDSIAKNIPDTRSIRSTISSKEFLLGLQKVFIFSEDVSASGINPIIDIMFSNQQMNDSTWVVVCKGKAVDMLKLKVEDAVTSSDHIDGIIESSIEQNFMSGDYKVVDVFVRVGSEGRDLVLPYLEILNNKITITGMVAFKKDKLLAKMPMEEARYMNFLRNNKVKGTLTLQKDSQHLVSTYGKVKRKVRCEKINGKYKFNIDLEFSGTVVSNTMYKDFMTNPETIAKYTHELEEETKKRCNEFINKMQNGYKTDCLELGRDAAAAFGRNLETDWDNIVCSADINVNVKVMVNNLGRGQFLFEKNKDN